MTLPLVYSLSATVTYKWIAAIAYGMAVTMWRCVRKKAFEYNWHLAQRSLFSCFSTYLSIRCSFNAFAQAKAAKAGFRSWRWLDIERQCFVFHSIPLDALPKRFMPIRRTSVNETHGHSHSGMSAVRSGGRSSSPNRRFFTGTCPIMIWNRWKRSYG